MHSALMERTGVAASEGSSHQVIPFPEPGWTLDRVVPVLREVVRSVGRRYRLRKDDVDDLFSSVCVKLLDDRRAVLARFEGRSAMSTYLTTVVTRVWLDQLIAREGKWRPSARATQLGPVAVELERLMQREHLPIAEAIATVQSAGRTTASAEALWGMAAQLPLRRVGARFVSLDDLGEVRSAQPAPRDQQAHVRRRHVVAALKALPPDDRMLIRRRFARGETVADIARSLSRDQRDLYRHYDRLLAGIRTRVEARERGLSALAAAV